MSELLPLNWIEEHDFLFDLPFNLGGIGTMQFALPFDVEAPALEVEFRLPFNISGSQTWAWSLPFDVGEDSEWAWPTSFDVLDAQPSPTIGGNIGVGGIWLTVAASAGATSVTTSTPLTSGRILRLGAATEYRLITGVVGNVASFTAPLVDSYPAGTPVAQSAATLDGSVAAGAMTIVIVGTVAVGDVITIDGEARTVTAVNGTTVTLSSPLSVAHADDAPIYVASSPAGAFPGQPLSAGYVDGLLIFDKAGNFLGNIPRGWFTIEEAPSRVIGDSGSMSFRMARADAGQINPYLGLIFDDRLVLVLDSINSEPWLGSMTVQDWGESQVQVSVADATALWVGPTIAIKEAPSTQLSAAAVYGKIADLMNAQRSADNELVWDVDIDTGDAQFFGDIDFEGTPFDLLEQTARRSVTEFAWRASFSGGTAHGTLVARETFTDAGFGVTDGEGGNVEARPRLLVDPSSIVHAIRVRGRPTDLAAATSECSTSPSIDCFDWMAEATGGATSSTQLIPEGFASVSPGERKRRDEMVVELDWGMSAPDQQAAASNVSAQAEALFHTFLRAYHDRYGRPFYGTDGWQYDGPPADIERFLNTGLGWRTKLRLVEYKGQPASLVMVSRDQQQALIVLYDLITGEKTVRRVWYTELNAQIWATRMTIHGEDYLWDVVGGVITGKRPSYFDHSPALVGPSALYWWPADGTEGSTDSYKWLRRGVSLTEDGAVSEAVYFSMDAPTGPTTGVYYDPPFNTQPVFTRPTIGDAPFKRFETVQITENLNDEDFISKVYEFEDRSICDWDPRRDGIGGIMNKVTVVNNQPSTTPRWHFVPWGDGSGTTQLSAGISAAETQIYVANSFVLPQTFPYQAILGTGLSAETVNVTAGSGTLLTIERGYNGTTAIIHPAGTQFTKAVDCDQEPEAEPDSSQTVPWPEGQAWAERLLERLSRPVRRLTVQVVNQDGEWAQVRYGSHLDVAIASEGPPGGIAGTWRVLGWAPNYHAGTMELLTEEVL